MGKNIPAPIMFPEQEIEVTNFEVLNFEAVEATFVAMNRTR